MDDRGYIAQALFDRWREAGVAFVVLGDNGGYPESAPAEIEIAVSRRELRDMPRSAARFCQDFDLQLVELERPEPAAWRCVFAWSDDIGRPRFIGARICSDYYRGGRRLLEAEELLAAAPEILFIQALLEGIERGQLAEYRLSSLWHEKPHATLEQVARFWRAPADIRLIARAAKRGDWSAVRGSLPRLRRAMRFIWPRPAAFLRRRRRARVAFTGREGGARAIVMAQVARDLAPLALELFEDLAGAARRADLRIVFDAPGTQEMDDIVTIAEKHGMPAAVARAESAILRWLEWRVERRYPDAVVGENPAAARLLQMASTRQIPVLKSLLGMLLNSAIACRIRSPILMPYPYGIVIERGAVIGSRVTVMQQASLLGGPVIEDNVCIGPGARVIGPVRIGRGATVGANAVVTREVPSHCTVVGANRILGREKNVVEKRRQDERSVVDT